MRGAGDQRPLQADPLPHAAREAADRIGGAIAQARLIQRRGDARLGIGDAVERGEEAQVLGGGQLRIEAGIVAQPADAPAHGGRRHAAVAARRRARATRRARAAASRSSVVLPAPFGPNRPVMLPARQVNDTRDRTRDRP